MQLVRWEAAKHAIAVAHSVDELRQIRDKAEAYRYALKLAGEAPAVVRQAEEIKVRAERRAGEVLSPTQLRRIAELKAAGAIVIVVTSVQDVEAALKELL